MSQQLPLHPNLDHLKKQAKDVLRVFRRQKPQWKLADAQHAVARGYGFVNWSSLKTHVEKVRHEQRDDSSVAKTSLGRSVSNGEDRAIHPAIHPIVGAWVSNEDVVVEFQLNEEEIKLTQVGTDTAGHEIAIRTTICADGQEHPAPFGEGVRLKAFWTTSLRLDATLTTSDRTISRCSYEVSADGKSLVVSTAENRILFKRL
jgi:hypothetical protein